MSKNGCVWATQWPTSSELKIKFDPSSDRSWYEFFKITKDHGPKNPPLGCNMGKYIEKWESKKVKFSNELKNQFDNWNEKLKE